MKPFIAWSEVSGLSIRKLFFNSTTCTTNASSKGDHYRLHFWNIESVLDTDCFFFINLSHRRLSIEDFDFCIASEENAAPTELNVEACEAFGAFKTFLA